MFRYRVPFVALILLLFTVAGMSAPPLQLKNYDIDFQLDVPNGRIQVDAVIAADKQKDVEQVVLLLTERAALDTVAAVVGDQQQLLASAYIGRDSLQLNLPAELKAATGLQLKFKYSIEIPQWGGSMMVLGRGHHWYPMIVDQIATVHLKTAAFSTFELYSAGDLISRSIDGDWEHREYQTRTPVFKIPLVIARQGLLGFDSLTANGVTCYLRTSKQDPVPTEGVLQQAAALLAYYQNLLGPYPHESLTIIEVGGFGGIEIGSGLLLIGSNAFRQYAQRDYNSLSLSIANQWLGAGIFPKFGADGFWFLTLSIPHYLRIMNLESELGGMARDTEINQLRTTFEPIAGTASDQALLSVDMPDSEVKGKLIYAKGPLVVDQLRQQLGDAAWTALLKDMYRQYGGKIMTYADFKKLVGKHDQSGEAAAQLDRLLTTTGMP